MFSRLPSSLKILTVEFTVSGEVQRVGFRRSAQRVARKLGIKGTVKNLEDGTVRIVAQGNDENSLQEFEKSLLQLDSPIKVEGIVKKPLQSHMKFDYFKIISGTSIEEMQEGFGAMESQFNDYRDEFRNYRKEFRGFAERTDENFGRMDDKYGEISKKLTSLLETVEKESQAATRELTRAVDRLVAVLEKFGLNGPQGNNTPPQN